MIKSNNQVRPSSSISPSPVLTGNDADSSSWFQYETQEDIDPT